MTETKHTPGPWHINHDRPDDKHSQLSITNGNAKIITNVVTYAGTHGLDGGTANARLIAAAPDMLACLKWIQPYAEVQIRNHPDATDTPQWRAVVAAIAKATGA